MTTIAESETRDRSERGEHKAFGEELAKDPAAASADGDANSHLAFAGDGSRQHQASEIGASDCEDEQSEDTNHCGSWYISRLHYLQMTAGRTLKEFVLSQTASGCCF